MAAEVGDGVAVGAGKCAGVGVGVDERVGEGFGTGVGVVDAHAASKQSAIAEIVHLIGAFTRFRLPTVS
jgi:hypothetical protein